ncbi:alpha-glucosidase [Roseobacter sinensis]|uniref:Alpha-glucosidase n=1 Tax=Roseobacter sinensis TaxID=2931391 RepID=A0ABT3BIH7_9RHOB|nr:alpha-glucosidase [Roseobacter sp. WL0113]MCV3273381.1 alpha-glucosidase [Roseobacter sp. WL0113]
MPTEKWWHGATGYQIYPRSFCDSNGDGIGDIPGIISKFDYLADLGIGFIWLSPVYASPMADNGYDIADYRAIAPEFGTLEDFDHLVSEAAARGIGIVMDLVVNHSSSQHRWFKAARSSRLAAEHDYYIWRDPAPDGGPPNDRAAFFGGPAWTYVPEVGRYYLHLFSPEQPDLNWANPKLRREIFEMMNWWLDRGIAGFRMDVIDLIGKDIDAGHYDGGPHIHRYLREMRQETLAGRDAVTVGESWNVTLDTALDFCGRDRGELDMMFQFHHVPEGWDPVQGKRCPKRFDLVAFKRVLWDWQEKLADDGWNALFLSNHDLPRQVSRYGDDGRYRVEAAKTLATVMHLMKGTPFVYQGEEIGMTNTTFTRIDQFRDIETLRHYAEQTAQGVTSEAFLAVANAFGRDNARTPMQWTGGRNAGFTTGTPWIEVNPSHEHLNVASDRRDPNGVFVHYRRLIALRREMPTIRDGRYQLLLPDHPAIFSFARDQNGDRWVVVANLSSGTVEFDARACLPESGEVLLSTHLGVRDLSLQTQHLRAYESFVVRELHTR